MFSGPRFVAIVLHRYLQSWTLERNGTERKLYQGKEDFHPTKDCIFSQISRDREYHLYTLMNYVQAVKKPAGSHHMGGK